MASLEDVYTSSGPLSLQAQGSWASFAGWQCFQSQWPQDTCQEHYSAFGGPKASFYIVPGCDLKSALLHQTPSNEEEGSKDIFNLRGSFSSQQHRWETIAGGADDQREFECD